MIRILLLLTLDLMQIPAGYPLINPMERDSYYDGIKVKVKETMNANQQQTANSGKMDLVNQIPPANGREIFDGGILSTVFNGFSPPLISETADDFRVNDECWRIERVKIWANGFLNVTNWTLLQDGVIINIYNNMQNEPGNLIHTETIDANDVISITPVELEVPIPTAFIFEYEMKLESYFDVNAGEYWFSAQFVNSLFNTTTAGAVFLRQSSPVTGSTILSRFDEGFGFPPECTDQWTDIPTCFNLNFTTGDMAYSLAGSVNGCCSVNKKCECVDNARLELDKKHVINRLYLDTADECCSECRKNKKCQTWSFNGNKKMCRLFRPKLSDDIIIQNYQTVNNFVGGVRNRVVYDDEYEYVDAVQPISTDDHNDYNVYNFYIVFGLLLVNIFFFFVCWMYTKTKSMSTFEKTVDIV